MGEKARKKFAELHEAYEKARSAREYSTVLGRVGAADEAASTFAADDGLVRIEAQLEAMGDERKALKRLVKYARKHGKKLAGGKEAATPAPAPTNGSARRSRGAPAAVA